MAEEEQQARLTFTSDYIHVQAMRRQDFAYLNVGYEDIPLLASFIGLLSKEGDIMIEMNEEGEEIAEEVIQNIIVHIGHLSGSVEIIIPFRAYKLSKDKRVSILEECEFLCKFVIGLILVCVFFFGYETTSREGDNDEFITEFLWGIPFGMCASAAVICILKIQRFLGIIKRSLLLLPI